MFYELKPVFHQKARSCRLLAGADTGFRKGGGDLDNCYVLKRCFPLYEVSGSSKGGGGGGLTPNQGSAPARGAQRKQKRHKNHENYMPNVAPIRSATVRDSH